MREHPWSIGGGGAAELKVLLEDKVVRPLTLRDVSSAIGRTTHTGEDDVYFLTENAVRTRLFSRAVHVGLCRGEDVRDWSIMASQRCLLPYDGLGEPRELTPREREYYWDFRTTLRRRSDFGQNIESRVVGGRRLTWYDHSMFFPERLRTPLSITFAFKATHNHFVLDRGGKVFNRTAPVIKLPAGATEEEHLALLGQLNSSTACFWMKQVCHNCGYSAGAGGGRTTAEPFDDFYELDGTKLQSFPVATPRHALVEELARAIDEVARARQARSVASVFESSAAAGSASLRTALDARQAADLRDLAAMVALQEELDWLCYELYGLDTPPADERRAPDVLPPLSPGSVPSS
jgi:hypothetical protein